MNTESTIDRKLLFAHMVAVSENGVIGRDYEMLWKLPNDFKYFKNKTWGLAIIMGRKTYQSLEKPLPGRYNIVITKNKDWMQEGVTVVHSLDEAIAKAVETDCKKIFIIGGGRNFPANHQSCGHGLSHPYTCRVSRKCLLS